MNNSFEIHYNDISHNETKAGINMWAVGTELPEESLSVRRGS